jgi:hypothetical protein
MKDSKSCLLGLAFSTLLCGLAVLPARADDTARAVVMDAATALGGLGRVQNVKNTQQ